MKFAGRYLVGSNQSGKGDDYRKVDKKKYDKHFDEIDFGDSRKVCTGCGKLKQCTYATKGKKKLLYFCSDCKKQYKKQIN